MNVVAKYSMKNKPNVYEKKIVVKQTKEMEERSNE